MFNKRDFISMRREYHNFNKARETLIKKSRELLKLSKQVIYSVHRNNLKNADKLVKKLNKEFAAFSKISRKNCKLTAVGQFKIAVAEYVEAMLYYNFIKRKKMAGHTQLKVPTECYLTGLCDFTGELVRKAVFLAGKNKKKEVIEIKDIIDSIYGELLNFDFRNGELRKKFDSVKYNLKKLEDLALQFKLKR